jgi:hypothetical protein
MNVSDGQSFSNISAATAAFRLKGGRYSLTAVATWGGGNIAVQMLAPDGSTWITPLNKANSANILSANGQQVMDLPAGQYRINVTTASAVYAAIASVPS